MAEVEQPVADAQRGAFRVHFAKSCSNKGLRGVAGDQEVEVDFAGDFDGRF